MSDALISEPIKPASLAVVRAERVLLEKQTVTSELLIDRTGEANGTRFPCSLVTTISDLSSSSLIACGSLSKNVEERASDGNSGVAKCSLIDGGSKALTMQQEVAAKSLVRSSATFSPYVMGEAIASKLGRVRMDSYAATTGASGLAR